MLGDMVVSWLPWVEVGLSLRCWRDDWAADGLLTLPRHDGRECVVVVCVVKQVFV